MAHFHRTPSRASRDSNLKVLVSTDVPGFATAGRRHGPLRAGFPLALAWKLHRPAAAPQLSGSGPPEAGSGPWPNSCFFTEILFLPRTFSARGKTKRNKKRNKTDFQMRLRPWQSHACSGGSHAGSLFLSVSPGHSQVSELRWDVPFCCVGPFSWRLCNQGPTARPQEFAADGISGLRQAGQERRAPRARSGLSPASVPPQPPPRRLGVSLGQQVHCGGKCANPRAFKCRS